MLTHCGAHAEFIDTFAKRGPSIILEFDRQQLRCVVDSGAATSAGAVYGAVSMERIFAPGFVVQSQNNNHIALEVDAAMLLCALKSGREQSELEVRLAKKQPVVGAGVPSLPILRLTCADATGYRTITQEVPVRVLSPAESALYAEPNHGVPDVSLFLPVRRVRTVLEQMRLLAAHVHITAKLTGELSFNIRTDSVSATTYLSQLPIARPEAQAERDPDEAAELVAVACVDLKPLTAFLSSIAFDPSHVILVVYPAGLVSIHALRHVPDGCGDDYAVCDLPSILLPQAQEPQQAQQQPHEH